MVVQIGFWFQSLVEMSGNRDSCVCWVFYDLNHKESYNTMFSVYFHTVESSTNMMIMT